MSQTSDPIADADPAAAGSFLPNAGYWRSVDQIAAAAGTTDPDEFPPGAAEPPVLDDVSRRGFLGIAAASMAMAGMTSCRKPYTKILPFSQRPEDLVPGNPLYYASAHVQDGYGVGILVKSSDGRPTKIEGNPLHPSSQGAATQLMQAELLNLYDPARSRHPRLARAAEPAAHDAGHGPARPAAPPTIGDFAAFWQGDAPADGAGLHVLIEPTTSPSVQAGLTRLRQKYPAAKVHTWAPVNHSAAVAGTRLAFGQALDTRWDLEKADVIVAVECDFVYQDGDGLRQARQYAARRRLTKEDQADGISRLYAIESFHSITGSNADHRFRIRASECLDVLLALAHELAANGAAIAGLDTRPYADLVDTLTYNGKPWVPALAKDLLARRGRSALLPGPRLAPEAQALVHLLNHALGNTGETILYSATPPGMDGDCVASIRELTTAMGEGKVDTLVILGGNPVYNAPADLDFARRLAKVKTSVHLSQFVDETSDRCTWHLNETHFLEAWSDILSRDGKPTIAQPLIAPLYGGLSVIELLSLLSDGMERSPAAAPGEAAGPERLRSAYDLVQATWKPRASGTFQTWWNRAVHDGLVPGITAGTASADPAADALGKALAARPRATAGSLEALEIQFRPSHNVHDGRYANNAWLMELPDPMTKLTWDNAALISLRTLNGLGVAQGDIVEFRAGERSVKAPVWVLPGHADHSVTMTLGFGRHLNGEHLVAKGAGFDAYALRPSTGLDLVTGATATPTGEAYQLATTQEHGSLEGRDHVRENDVAGYQNDPFFAPHMSPLHHAAEVHNHNHHKHGAGAHDPKDDHAGHDHGPQDADHPDPARLTAKDMAQSLWDDSTLPPAGRLDTGHQWGMVIDLNSCIGCNACVAACVSENNIATVGKDQVARGREMFWLRVDRYFGNDVESNPEPEGIPELHAIPAADNPKVLHQPVPCMQCEKAPCEVVCPVTATTHSPEGLNDMAYNRCIGTRYCGNNCPYKVRHFNYFNFHREVPETIKMTRNPDVTIRSRGVMEKCTYCVQRINRGKIYAKVGDRPLKDGDIVPACGQTCPTQAITFGDINDENSRVSQLKASNLNYGMLDELNTRPRTTYLAQIRNPNPELV